MEDAYTRACTEPSDINEHIPILYSYAKRCEHITELGTRSCVSTRAFIKGLSENEKDVKKLVSIDIDWHPNVDDVKACAGQVDYTFIQSSSLERTPDMTDITFIDTWHVYPQLKRELALYAPVTKQYIIMHDTTIDAEHGESVRDCHDISRQSIETGFSEEDIRQGLKRAIDEFLSWNGDDWDIERVWTNNNGLTVLRRQQPLFLVTSVIHVIPSQTDFWKSSVYSISERYNQTLETIQSIRARVPFARIVVLEGSQPRVLFETADETIHIPVSTLPKSIGEATLLKTFLEQDSLDGVSICVKVSGRYTLTESFDIRRFSKTKISIRQTKEEWSKNEDKTVCKTMLFAFPPKLRHVMLDRLQIVQNRGPDIEHSIVYGYRNIKNLSVLSVQGHLAPTGEFITY